MSLKGNWKKAMRWQSFHRLVQDRGGNKRSPNSQNFWGLAIRCYDVVVFLHAFSDIWNFILNDATSPHEVINNQIRTQCTLVPRFQPHKLRSPLEVSPHKLSKGQDISELTSHLIRVSIIPAIAFSWGHPPKNGIEIIHFDPGVSIYKKKSLKSKCK